MAKKKSNSSKNGRFLSRVHKITETDIFTSIAIASILLNVLFLVTIFVLSSTDTFDRSVYKSVRSQYCKNVSGVEKRAEELGSEKDALKEWQINCNSAEFQPFFNEAIEKFNAQN
jgi:hypothetical protein